MVGNQQQYPQGVQYLPVVPQQTCLLFPIRVFIPNHAHNGTQQPFQATQSVSPIHVTQAASAPQVRFNATLHPSVSPRERSDIASPQPRQQIPPDDEVDPSNSDDDSETCN